MNTKPLQFDASSRIMSPCSHRDRLSNKSGSIFSPKTKAKLTSENLELLQACQGSLHETDVFKVCVRTL